jgi:hypothetical protein
VLAPGAVTHVAVAPVAGAVVHGVVTVAAIAGLAVVGVAAAVLIARAAVAGTEALAGGLVRLRDAMQDAEQRRIQAECVAIEAEACWEAAARAAVRANSELRVVRAALRRAGASGDPSCPPLPSPVPVAGRSLAGVLAETERVTRDLQVARAFLAEHRRRTARRIAESARTGTAERTDPAPKSTRDIADRPRPEAPRLPEPDPGVVAEIDQLLADVPEDAEPRELTQLHAAAAEARRAPAFWLPQLASAVEQLRVNTARARRHAAEAAEYLEGIAAIDIDPTDPHVSSVLAGLNDVVAGQRDMSESLRDDARLLIADGELAAANRLLADRLRECFRADGFDVRSTSAAGNYEVLEVTRAGLPLHSARVSVGRGEISHRTSVGGAPESPDQPRTHRGWCDGVSA